jgi:hypothetical protein
MREYKERVKEDEATFKQAQFIMKELYDSNNEQNMKLQERVTLNESLVTKQLKAFRKEVIEKVDSRIAEVEDMQANIDAELEAKIKKIFSLNFADQFKSQLQKQGT